MGRRAGTRAEKHRPGALPSQGGRLVRSQRRSGSVAGSGSLIIFALVVVTVVVGARLAGSRHAGGDAVALRVIAGGPFEASGVAYVPGSNYVLFVDDDHPSDLFLMEIAPDGHQRGTAVSVPLGASVTDMEAITSDGRHFYVVGSQSKSTGFDGDGLVRFTFDPETRRVGRVERIQALKAWLAANVPELRGIERRVGDHVLNVEGLAWDPRRDRLLLGLRAPTVGGEALVVPLKVIDPAGPFSHGNIRVDGAAIHVRLGGTGIRSLEYDEGTSSFKVITGAQLNAESRDFRVVQWSGEPDSPVRQVSRLSRRLKPEGITRAVLNGRSVSIIVFDTGGFAITD